VTVIVPRLGAAGPKHQRIRDRMHIAGQDVPTQALDDVGERESETTRRGQRSPPPPIHNFMFI
jgi:hypothetical protein